MTNWYMLGAKESRLKFSHTKKTDMLANVKFISTVCEPHRWGSNRKVIWNLEIFVLIVI
jgi:hypothetical protein